MTKSEEAVLREKMKAVFELERKQNFFGALLELDALLKNYPGAANHRRIISYRAELLARNRTIFNSPDESSDTPLTLTGNESSKIRSACGSSGCFDSRADRFADRFEDVLHEKIRNAEFEVARKLAGKVPVARAERLACNIRISLLEGNRDDLRKLFIQAFEQETLTAELLHLLEVAVSFFPENQISHTAGLVICRSSPAEAAWLSFRNAISHYTFPAMDFPRAPESLIISSLDEQPDHASARLDLVFFLAEKGEFERARQELLFLLDRLPPVDSLLALDITLVFFEYGTARAEELAEKYLSLLPDSTTLKKLKEVLEEFSKDGKSSNGN